MNYQTPERCRALAAEFVLGTLSGAARRRFERLCAAPGGEALQAERRQWELRLAALDRDLRPLPPPETAWIGLQRRVERAAGSAGAATVVRLPPRAPASPWLRSWAWLATAASLTLAVLLGYNYTHPPGPPQQVATKAPAYVAALNLPKAPMHFAVALSPARSEMTVAASGSYPDLGAHSLELWWISAKGPVALGVLPTQGHGRMKLPPGMPQQGKLTLAISLEPAGGSPTGQPTGPVLVSGEALQAI